MAFLKQVIFCIIHYYHIKVDRKSKICLFPSHFVGYSKENVCVCMLLISYVPVCVST
jgi:hypothetical protein